MRAAGSRARSEAAPQVPDGDPPPPPRILVVGPDEHARGGIAQFSTRLCERLEGDAVVRRMSYRRLYPAWTRAGRNQSDHVAHAEGGLLPWSPASWRRERREVARFRPDLVVIQWWHPFFTASVRSVMRAAARAGASTTVVVHNVTPHERFPFARRLTRSVLARADRIVALSGAVAAELRALVPHVPVRVAAHPPNLATGDAAPEAAWSDRIGPTEGPVILFFGNVRGYKGLEDLIDAMPGVRERAPATLVVAGQFFTDADRYRRRAEERGIAPHVRFVPGYVADDEVGSLLARADVVVLPYRSGSQSGVVPLAAEAGRPVVVTDVGGLAESVNGHGVVVPPRDPAALSDGIVRALADPPPPPRAPSWAAWVSLIGEHARAAQRAPAGRALSATRSTRRLIYAAIVAASLYVGWWLVPGHMGHPVLFGLLATAEGFSLLHVAGMWWSVMAMRAQPPPARHTAFAVDVLVPTCGEPLNVIERTLRAAVAMDGPHTTYVLDDGRDDEVRALAARLGVVYLRREGRDGAKAGNLNAALRQVTAELVAVFDADHAPRPDFLTRLLGYFEDPNVAFVQTPQFYRNSAQEEVAQGAYLQQVIFYGPISRGKNGVGSAFCCGTNVVFRREALEEVGGFDERSVVEDFVTSMQIHRAGWRSVYHPYILAEGLGPHDMRSYFRQQFRWARGSVGALMSGEPFRRGFSLAQRAQYLLATTFYLIGLVTAIYISLPIVYLLGGPSPFSPDTADFVVFYAPYLTLAFLVLRSSLGGRLSLRNIQFTFGSFAVYAAAAVAAILHLPARFHATGRRRTGRASRVALIPVAAFAATAAAVVAAPFVRDVDARTATTMSWAAINMLLLWGMVRVAFPAAFPALAARVRARTRAPALRRIQSPDMLPEEALALPPRRALRPAGSALRWVAWATAAGLAWRAAFVAFQGVRLDEALSLQQIRQPLVDLWRSLAEGNIHVPLYHTLLRGWTAIAGDGIVAARALSVLLGAAAIPLMYVVGKQLAGPRTGRAAAVIAAVAPIWLWHGTEARMYPLMIVVLLGATAALIAALRHGGAWRWALYAGVTGVGFYTHYFMAFVPLVHLLYLAVQRPGWRRTAAWALAIGGALVLFSPWLVLLYETRIEARGFASFTNAARLPPVELTPYGLIHTFGAFMLGYVIGYQPGGILTPATVLLIGVWPLLILRSVMAERPGWMRRHSTRFLVLWIVLPLAVVFVLDRFVEGVFLQRYLIVVSPAVLLLLADRVARVRRMAPVLAAVALVLAGLGVVGQVAVGNPVREDFRAAAAVLQRESAPGDVVVAVPGFVAPPLRHYRQPVVVVDRLGRSTNVVVTRIIPQLAIEHRDDTVWVVEDRLYTEAASPHVDARVLRQFDIEFRRLEEWSFGRIRLIAYAPVGGVLG